MFRSRVWLAVLLAVLVAGQPLVARADTPVADPGFAFVDVNGDGKYSASDGDIGLASSPSVDVESLILSTGNFNTQVSQGAYHAPSANVSLVIPASRSLTLTVPLQLKAGKNLLVYGTLQAPSINLTASGNVDLTASNNTFTTTMYIGAGGSTILDGAVATGTGANSSFSLNAFGNVSAKLIPSNGFVTGILTNGSISICSKSACYMDQAALTALGSNAMIMIMSQGVFQAVDFTSLSAGGGVSVRSYCTNLVYQNSSSSGSSVSLRANGNIDITGASLNSAGTVLLLSLGAVTGNSPFTAINASGISVNAPTGIDLGQSALLASATPISLQASGGPIGVANTSITSFGGLQAHAQKAISAAGVTAHANHYLTFTSDTGQIDMTGSTITQATSSTTDTYVSVVGPGAITANSANWTVPVSITLNSTASNITARAASFQATAASGTVSMIASGLLIDVTGSTFVGSVTFGPTGVVVIGP